LSLSLLGQLINIQFEGNLGMCSQHNVWGLRIFEMGLLFDLSCKSLSFFLYVNHIKSN
jgi:hypothetical protein